MDTTEAADCSSIIKAFEKHALSAPTEPAIMAGALPRVAAINMNAAAAASNLRNAVNPPIPNEAVSGSFSEAQSTATTIDLGLSIPGTNSNTSVTDPKDWRDWIESCIPCELRLDLRIDLLNSLDDALLDILEQIINNYLKELAFILNLLNATDVYADVCPILFALRDVCIPDLQRILSLLAGILYRMTVRELTNIDLLKLLVLPLFQPIFNGLLTLLNQYKVLVTDPLQCVVANLDAQLNKIKMSSTLNESLVNELVTKADQLKLLESDSDKEEMRASLNKARQPFESLDQGIESMQSAMGASVYHLRRLTMVGIFEVESLLAELKRELANFLGIDENETIDMLLNQYEKLLIFRLISFIAALIKAKAIGFNCNFDNPAQAEDTVGRFLSEFLGPNSPVIVTNNSVTGEIQLLFNPTTKSTLEANIPESRQRFSTLLASPDPEVSVAINGIIAQSSQPVTIKPACVFDSGLVDNNQMAQWLKELQESA